MKEIFFFHFLLEIKHVFGECIIKGPNLVSYCWKTLFIQLLDGDFYPQKQLNKSRQIKIFGIVFGRENPIL